MASNFVFANFFETELLEDISAGAGVLHVTPTMAARLPIIAEVMEARLVLWDGINPPEIVSVIDNQQTGYLSVLRAREGTSSRSWPTGTQVICSLTAEIINAALQAYFDVQTLLAANFLALGGGTLTGALLLAADPTSALGAVTKQYVDATLGDKLPLAGGTMLGGINMNGNRVINLSAGVASTEPVRKAEFDASNAQITAISNNTNGALISGGTSIAYTIAPIFGTPITVLADSMVVSARLHVTNDANPTLAYSNAPAAPIYLLPGIPVPEKHMQAGQAYDFILNGGVWLLKGTLRSSLRNRPGDIKWSFIAGDHDDCLLCDGRSLLRTQFPTLFSNIGTMFGAVDGTHFNIPDQSGRTMVGVDVSGAATIVVNVTTTAGLNTGTLASVSGVAIGQYINCANLPAGTSITDLVGTTATFSNNASASSTVSAKISPFRDSTAIGSTGGQFTHIQNRKEVGQHLHANTVGETPHIHTLNQLSGATVMSTAGGSTNYAAGAFGAISAASGISLNTATAGVTITNVDSASPLPMGIVQPSWLGNMFIYAY